MIEAQIVLVSRSFTVICKQSICLITPVSFGDGPGFVYNYLNL